MDRVRNIKLKAEMGIEIDIAETIEVKMVWTHITIVKCAKKGMQIDSHIPQAK